jgi:hypothetical protein
MRTILVDQRTDLQGLRRRLSGDQAIPESAIERLRQLNAHVSLDEIPAGTVLLVPELPGLRPEGASAVGGEPFDALRQQLLGSLDAVGSRVRAGYEELLAEAKEVTAVQRLAAFRRALEADPGLREQTEAAAEVREQDRANARDADRLLTELREEAAAELAALAKVLAT